VSNNALQVLQAKWKPPLVGKPVIDFAPQTHYGPNSEGTLLLQPEVQQLTILASRSQ
jgi:hypothetical protein